MYLMLRTIAVYFFFFFQAEDGIRDLTVTGVQTCALPILRDPLRLRVHSRGIDDEHRRVELPVRPKHLPTSGNHALPAIFNLARPFGICADQMRATNNARLQTTSRETVESRTTSPDTNAIGRAGPLDDRLDNRTMIARLLTQYG